MADYQTLEEFAQHTLMPGEATIRHRSRPSTPGRHHLDQTVARDDDFARGATAFGVGEGLPGLVERISLVDDGSEDGCIDQFGDLVQLRAAGAHEQE